MDKENASGQADKMKALTAKLEQGVKEVFTGGRYSEYLNTMAKFHSYSYRNTMLIFLQRPDATRVAGFEAWKSFGRNVNKGEKGIQILAPSPYKKMVMVNKDEQGRPLPEPQTKEITVAAFKPAYVFDVTQTWGKELPQLAARLTGSVAEYDRTLEALRRMSPCPIEFESMVGSRNGYYDAANGRIAVREGLSQEQTVKTIFHEIAHAKLNHGADLSIDRSTGEVQAESVAYIVCQHLGIDSSDYSFGYLANWSKDKDCPELQRSLAAIQTTAKDMIAGLDAQLERVIAPIHDRPQTIDEPQRERPNEVGYKLFYGGMGGQDQAAHDFQQETGWNMAWGSDADGLNGDTWIVYQSMDALPKRLQSIVSELQHEVSSPKRYAVDQDGTVQRLWNGKTPEQFTKQDTLLFMADTDIHLAGRVSDATVKLMEQAGYRYSNGKLMPTPNPKPTKTTGERLEQAQKQCAKHPRKLPERPERAGRER